MKLLSLVRSLGQLIRARHFTGKLPVIRVKFTDAAWFRPFRHYAVGSCFEVSRKPVELVPRIDETIRWAAWSFCKLPCQPSLDVLWTHSSSWACCVRCINNGEDTTGILKPQSCWEDTWREEKLGKSPAVDICLATSSNTRRAYLFLSFSSHHIFLAAPTHAILFHWTLLSMGQLKSPLKAGAPLLSSVWILSANFSTLSHNICMRIIANLLLPPFELTQPSTKTHLQGALDFHPCMPTLDHKSKPKSCRIGCLHPQVKCVRPAICSSLSV